MSNEEYWANRAAWNMYHYMDEAENTADLIAKVYRRASMWLSYEAADIFEKYMTKHKLSENEARRLLNSLHGRASVEELLNKLKEGNSEKSKTELLRELEAPAYQARLERLRQIQNQLDLVMKNVYQQEKEFSTTFYTDLANEAYYRSIFEIQKQTGFAFSFNHVSSKQIDQALAINWSGQHYSKRIWSNTQALAEEIKEELLISLITGRTERETAEIISNKFGQGTMRARRLVRTESCFQAAELTAMAYEECKIEQYMYLATLDLRTSEICRTLDGKLFSVSERKPGKNYPPMHPWCRSTTIEDITEEVRQNLKRRAYNPKTGRTERIPASMNYEQWHKKFVEGNPEARAEEKAIKNHATDRKQYERYKEVLGKDIPDSFVKFQKMKYNESEKWDFMKLDYSRRIKLIEHPELKLPNAESATAADAKFTKYLFGGEHPEGLVKGNAFESRLGYSAENWKELQRDITQRAQKYPSEFKRNNGYGKDVFEQKMILYGSKGTPANVVVGWSVDLDGTTMATAYIKEVK